MRRSLLLVALAPLLLAPPALAGDGHEAEADKAKSHCPPPEVEPYNTVENLAVEVRLPATGCPVRENTFFLVSAQLTRTDEEGLQESDSHALRCGPFESAQDRKKLGFPTGTFFCGVEVTLDHQPVDWGDYDLEMTYPGANGEETTRLTLFCTSDGHSAVCDKQES